MSDKPVLYSYFRSSCSYRVRIALNLKEIEVDQVAINLVKNDQRTDEYLQINPVGGVPTLKINDTILSQSVSIMEYLDEAFPEKHRLLPKDDLTKRALVRKLTLIICADIQPVQNLSVLRFIGDERKMELGKWVIDKGFHALEKCLEKSSGKYCVGDEITMVDICLVPQVFNANRFSVDMSQFPNITRIHEELVKHDAFIKAHPFRQPDCPDDLKIK